MSYKYFRLWISAIILCGAVPVQAAVTTYCCDAAAESRYLNDLAALGNTVGTVHEGFDAPPWGPDTFYPNSVKPSVTNQGLTWTPLSTTTDGFLATSAGGGDVHDGRYLMFSVYRTGARLIHPSPDGFSLAGDGSTLYGVGGWFRGFNGTKVSFVVDGNPNLVDFTGVQSSLDNTWKFLGFIETAGFNSVEIVEVEEVAGDETNYFWVDDFDIGTTASAGNTAPVADAGADQAVVVGGMVGLDGSGSSDVDGDALTYSWLLTSVPAGSTTTLLNATTATPSFVADVSGAYTAQLIVNDGTVDSLPDTVNISTTNTAPVADAGTDQTVFVGDTVTLDGSGSTDVDGDALIYSWTLTGVPVGSTAVLSDPTVVNPSFDVDLPGSYVAQLIVNDGTVSSDPATVTISTENSAPMADAGTDQTAFVGDTVSLDGSGSTDVDGDTLIYAWSLSSVPAGSGATLSDPAAVTPTFVVDKAGTYVVQLIVNDGLLDSDPATVTISTDNTAPVADAGADQTALVGDTVSLDGSGSTDVDGDALTYSWSLTSVPVGSTAVLSDPTVVNPSFGVDLPGSYVVQLIVNDGLLDSDPATVTISTENSAPVADAGTDQTAFVGDTVMLDGSGSIDVDGDPLTYLWSLTSVPAGSTATLTDPTAMQPSFDVDLPGSYVAQLIVNDGTVSSDPATVTISTENSAPVADAGTDQTAFVGDTVMLDGSGSIDVDGDPLTYLWSLTSVPAGSTATLTDPTAMQPSFDVDLPGEYVAQLIVNDDTVDSLPDTVNISTTNSAPVADAGADQKVVVGDTVTLDGSASSDADGDFLSYSWSLINVPAGSAATLLNATTATPSFVADVSGTYTAQLIVNDGLLDSVPATVNIMAKAIDGAPVIASAVWTEVNTAFGRLTVIGEANSRDLVRVLDQNGVLLFLVRADRTGAFELTRSLPVDRAPCEVYAEVDGIASEYVEVEDTPWECEEIREGTTEYSGDNHRIQDSKHDDEDED